MRLKSSPKKRTGRQSSPGKKKNKKTGRGKKKSRTDESFKKGSMRPTKGIEQGRGGLWDKEVGKALKKRGGGGETRSAAPWVKRPGTLITLSGWKARRVVFRRKQGGGVWGCGVGGGGGKRHVEAGRVGAVILDKRNDTTARRERSGDRVQFGFFYAVP